MGSPKIREAPTSHGSAGGGVVTRTTPQGLNYLDIRKNLMSAHLKSCFFYGIYLHSPCSGQTEVRMLKHQKGYETIELCSSHLQKQNSPNALPYMSVQHRSKTKTDPQFRSVPPPSGVRSKSTQEATPKVKPAQELAPKSQEAPSQYIMLPEKNIIKRMPKKNVDVTILALKKMTQQERTEVLSCFCAFCFGVNPCSCGI